MRQKQAPDDCWAKSKSCGDYRRGSNAGGAAVCRRSSESPNLGAGTSWASAMRTLSILATLFIRISPHLCDFFSVTECCSLSLTVERLAAGRVKAHPPIISISVPSLSRLQRHPSTTLSPGRLPLSIKGHGCPSENMPIHFYFIFLELAPATTMARAS